MDKIKIPVRKPRNHTVETLHQLQQRNGGAMLDHKREQRRGHVKHAKRDLQQRMDQESD